MVQASRKPNEPEEEDKPASKMVSRVVGSTPNAPWSFRVRTTRKSVSVWLDLSAKHAQRRSCERDQVERREGPTNDLKVDTKVDRLAGGESHLGNDLLYALVLLHDETMSDVGVGVQWGMEAAGAYLVGADGA